jgi:hypothetical protein
MTNTLFSFCRRRSRRGSHFKLTQYYIIRYTERDESQEDTLERPPTRHGGGRIKQTP